MQRLILYFIITLACRNSIVEQQFIMGDQLKGVSIIVCCYNGIERIEKTIEYLVAQQLGPTIPWEIIIVDNASTDGTYGVAEAKLQDLFPNGDFSLVQERSAGLSIARKKGIETARYEYIIFCDDDNWLSPSYAQQVYDHFESNTRLGIVGGQAVGVFEADKPSWFSPQVEKSYALGKQAPSSGLVNAVWGAGMGLRKTAYDQLMYKGFKHLNTDRVKDKLSGGGDIEICIGIGRMGFLIWYDENLIFQHLVPAERINFEYAKNLYYFIGFVSPSISVYQKAFNPGTSNNWSNYWMIGLLKNYLLLIVILLKPARSKYFKVPNEVVKAFIVSSQKGRVDRLLLMKGKYNKIIKQIRNAQWNFEKC